MKIEFNKKTIYVVVLMLCLLLGISLSYFKQVDSNNKIKTNQTGTGEVQKIYSVNYTSMLEDGTILDTTYRKVAEKNNILKTGTGTENYYSPQKIILGMGEIQKPIEDALKTMKAGEKKRVVLSPQYAYGEKTKTVTTTLENIKYAIKVFSLRDLENYNDKSKIVVGSEVITGTGEKISKGYVLKIVNEMIYTKIDNPNNPFGENIKVGVNAKGLDTGNDFEIKSINEKTGDVEINIKNNNKYAGLKLVLDLELDGIQ